MKANCVQRTRGFTLVELLVVIGIIALLLSILLPTIQGAQRNARQIKCAAQLYQIGQYINMYANNYRGWMFPVGVELPPPRDPENQYDSLGSNKYPWERWPVILFNDHKYPTPTAAQIAQPLNYYMDHAAGQAEGRAWSPPIMLCPADNFPPSGTSYVVNKYLTKNSRETMRVQTKAFDGRSPGEVVVVGEKYTNSFDYYMEKSEYPNVVEERRHGIRQGSNYLYKDWHVSLDPPRGNDERLRMLDPWDVPTDQSDVNPVPPAAN